MKQHDMGMTETARAPFGALHREVPAATIVDATEKNPAMRADYPIDYGWTATVGYRYTFGDSGSDHEVYPDG